MYIQNTFTHAHNHFNNNTSIVPEEIGNLAKFCIKIVQAIIGN